MFLIFKSCDARFNSHSKSINGKKNHRIFFYRYISTHTQTGRKKEMRGGIIGWKVGQIDRDKQNNIYRQHRQIDYFERQTKRLADR